MSREDINRDMRAFEPQARLIRRFMKLNNVSDETAVNVLRDMGVLPSQVSLQAFRDHEVRRSIIVTGSVAPRMNAWPCRKARP
jgi:hypothetical protein